MGKEYFEPASIILAAPGKRLLYELNGVDSESVSITRKTNKTHTISFTVNKYVDGVLSNGYDWIDEQMELYVDGMWFVINNPPTIENDSYQEQKIITAESLEIRLQQYMLNTFAVNQGVEYSYEMMYREEHPTDKDGNTMYYQVTFYNPAEPKLSLLHLVLEHAEVPEWTIGYVDNITVNPADNMTFLPNEVANFDVDDKSVYAFLTQDVAPAVRCIFEFDTVNMKINCYRPESLGKDTNVVIDFHNIQNSLTINRNNPLVTAFNVMNSDTNIDYVNPVGGSIIEDLTQLANEKFMGKTLAEKYLAWIALRDSYVEPYMEISKKYHGLLTTISEIYNRVPSDTVQNDYYSMTEEDLKMAYNSAIALVTALENKYKDTDGNLDLEALKTSADWDLYESTRNYTIPSIVAALQGKQAEIPENTDYYGLGNLLKNSVPVSFGNNSWIVLGSGDFQCVTLDDQPDYGMTSALKVKPTDTSGFEQTSIQTTVGNDYCLSVYVKATTAMTVNLQFGVSINRDERITESFEIAAGTWQRIHSVFTAEHKLADVAFTCSGSGEVLFTGMMLEIGDSPKAFSYYKLSDSELKSYETDWKLYGIDELESKLEVYQNSIDILTENGYNEPYDEKTSKDEPYHIKMHQQYLDYVYLRDACKAALDERIAEVKPYETERDSVQEQRVEINNLLRKENFGTSQSEHEGFTNKELIRLNILKNQNSYSNPNIIVTSIDTLQDEVDIQKRLYDDAMDQLYVESHYQYEYSDSIDNILDLPEFAVFKGELDINNFIRVGLDDEDNYVKLRVVEMIYNPCRRENDLQLVFSNVVNYRSKIDDLAWLIDETPASSKGQIVGSGVNSTASFFFTPEIISQLVSNPNFQSSLGGLTVGGSGYSGSAGFASTGGDGSITLTADKIISALVKAETGEFETITAETGFFQYLDTKLLSADRVVTKVLEAEQAEIDELTAKIVTSDSVITKMLEAEQAKIDELTAKMITADNAVLKSVVAEQIDASEINVDKITGDEGSFKKFFVDNLNVNSVFGNNADFKTIVSDVITTTELYSDYANIKNLLAGNAGIGDLQTINLTADNVVMNDAFVKEMIASKITVADLATHTASANIIKLISSSTGQPTIAFKDSTQQFYDSNGNVRVQIGQDNNGDFNFIIRGEDGTTALFDESGIKKEGIPNNIIVNDMIAESTIGKDRLSFPIVETDENGKVSITEILDGNGEAFGVKYTEFQETTNQQLETLDEKIDDIEIGGRNYLLNSSEEISKTRTNDTGNTFYDYKFSDGLRTLSNDAEMCFSMDAKSNSGILKVDFYLRDSSTGINKLYNTQFMNVTSEYCRYSLPIVLQDGYTFNDVVYCRVRLSTNGTVYFKNAKLEYGNKTTDWTPAPEDIDAQFTTVTNTISGIQSTVDNNTKAITDKVWQSDITTSIDNYDNTITQSIRDRVTQTETDISGVKTTVSDLETSMGDSVQELTERISTAEQTAEGFKQEVAQTYVTNDKFDSLEIGGRNLITGTSSDFTTITLGQFYYMVIRLNISDLMTKYGLSDGDVLTYSVYLKSSSGKPIAARWQKYNSSNDRHGDIGNIITNGEGLSVVYPVIDSNYEYLDLMITNGTPSTITTDSTEQYRCLKLEKGNKATDWTPAPEDVNESIRTVETQTAEKFNWLIESTSNSTSLTLTDKMIEAITGQFVVKSPDGSSTVIEGGKLSTEAIKSINYSPSDNPNSPYSAFGTYLNLQNGNFYTPNFGIDNIYGKAYLNGEIIASSGSLGFGINYWEISTLNDYNMNQSAALIGHGTSYIQAGNWQISNNKINTQSYANNRTLTYLNDGANYYDYGMQVPKFDTTVDYIKGVSDNFLYIRKSPQNTIPVLESDWIYLFRVDKDGNIYEGGQKLSEKYATLSAEGVYVPLVGDSTIQGNLTVTGVLNANVSGTTGVLTIGGKTFNGSSNVSVTLSDIGALGAKLNANGRYTMATPNGSMTEYIHTTEAGLLPYEAGGAGNGHGYLGTSSWYFSHAYIDTIYGNLIGTAQKATQDAEGNNIAETYLKKGDASIINPLKITYNGTTHTFTGATETSVNIDALPISGGTMNTNATITIPCQDGRKINLYNSGLDFFARTDGGGWITGIYSSTSDGAIKLGGIGMLGAGDTFKYYYFGTDYLNPLVKIEPNGTVTATKFAGNATSASKLETARNITIGSTTKSFDGSSALSFSLSEIASNATTSSAGWMSATDKSKLDSIEVDSSGNITALSIVAGNGISVATNASGQSVITNTQYAPTTLGTLNQHAVSTGSGFKWEDARALYGKYTRDGASSLNKAPTGIFSMSLMQSSSSTTIGKPTTGSGNGFILNFDWDTNGGWNSQFFVPNTAGCSLQWRSLSGTVEENTNTWSDWITVLDTRNYTNYTIAKSGDTMTGDLTVPNIHVTGTTSQMASHYYHKLYGDNCVYVHYYTDTSFSKTSSAVLRVSDSTNKTFKALKFSGDGSFTWNGNNVITSAGGTITGKLTTNGGIDNTGHYAMYNKMNFSMIPNTNNSEFSFDIGASDIGLSSNSGYTGAYAHFWSCKNSRSIISFHNDDASVRIPETNTFHIGNAKMSYNSTTETLNFSFA